MSYPGFFAHFVRLCPHSSVRQAHGPAIGHEFGPNGAKSKGERVPHFSGVSSITGKWSPTGKPVVPFSYHATA